MSVLDHDIRALLREALHDEPAPLTALEVSHRSVDIAWRAEAAPRSLPELRPRTRRRWVGPVVALAAIAVVVVGLIAIGTNRNQSVGNDPARWHWLLRDVPPGWKATTVFDSTTDPPRGPSTDGFVRNMYATDAEPLGPSLIVESTTDPNQSADIGSYSPNALGYEEFELDGKRAAFATLPDNAKGMYVEIDSAWVYIWSNGVSDEALRGLGRTLAADATGHYDVAGSALPDGMHKVDVATVQDRDYVSIDYLPSSGDGSSMYLSIAPAVPTPVGRGVFGYEFKAVAVGGFSGLLGVRHTSENATPLTTESLVLWRRDGLDFLLSGHGVTTDQILTAATSASLASPDEWADLLDPQNVGSNDTVATGSSPPVAPVDTEPAFVGEPRDVAITVTVDDVSNTEQQWSGVLPTGESWSATITRVYDRMDIRYSSDGNLVETSGWTSTAQETGDGQVTCCNPMAITKNPKAAALRVLRSNGDRYTIPLHELPGTDGERVALITIPDGTFLAELVDASGNVLESYTPR